MNVNSVLMAFALFIGRLRLRKKSWKNPSTIFLNDRVYEEDIPIFTNWEVFIELLDRKSVFPHVLKGIV